MVIVLALAFFLSAVVTVYLIFRIGDTRVPAVVGKTEVEATRMAEKAGLKVKVQRRNDPTTPENIVIETRPTQNSSVKKDSNLTLVVSSGPGQNRTEFRNHRLRDQISVAGLLTSGDEMANDKPGVVSVTAHPHISF